MVRGTPPSCRCSSASAAAAIVNIASLAGLVHPAGMASYNAVKAAVVALTETTGHELRGVRRHGARRVPVVLPDQPDELDAAAATRRSAKVIASLVESSPITADDIAAAVLEGLDRGDELIVPDQPARDAYGAQAAPTGAAYDAVMRAQAARLDSLTRGEPPDDRDESRPVRDEDAFDVEAVAGWLREHADGVRRGPGRHPGGDASSRVAPPT